MISSENKIIAAGLLAGLCGFVIYATAEAVIGLSEQLGIAVMLLLFILFGAVLPHLYLEQTNQSISTVSRLGVFTLVLVVFAAGFSVEATGTALTIILTLVSVSVILIVATELREGNQQSAQSENH